MNINPPRVYSLPSPDGEGSGVRQTAAELRSLASAYERASFIEGDPSWFMHQVEGRRNRETMAFIASAFSYGSRKQFMPRVQRLLDDSGGEVFEWVAEGRFLNILPDDNTCFYRLYTNAMVRQTLLRLRQMLRDHGSIKGFVAGQGADSALKAIIALTDYFRSSGGIIPGSCQSSCKRLCMFLRWMVRDNSPVDLGVWADIIDKRTLIMPLDTHVMQQANRLGLISTKTTSMSTALRLTERVREVFPDDPLKADFALFGYGVTRNTNKNKL